MGGMVNNKHVIQAIGHGEATPYALLSSIMAAAPTMSRTDAKVLAEKRHRLRLEDERQTRIRQNICPICNGKLIRGKKDKKNNYKRMWACKVCKSIHHI